MANADLDRAERAYKLICVFPGIRANLLCVMLGITYSATLSTLATMANNDLLVSEDSDGGLYVFEEVYSEVVH